MNLKSLFNFVNKIMIEDNFICVAISLVVIKITRLS